MKLANWKGWFIAWICAFCYPALAQVTGVNATCAPDGQNVTLSWSPLAGATAYAPRLNYDGNDGPACEHGWLCNDGSGDWLTNDLPSTSVVRSVTPGRPYGFWVHGLVSGAWSDYGWTMFTCTAPPPPPPPPAPVTGVNAACAPDGQNVTLSWNPLAGATTYAPRLNYGGNDSPACEHGWVCNDGSGDWLSNDLPSTSVVRSVTPGRPYGFWVHGLVSGAWSDYGLTSFACTAPVVTPVAPLNVIFQARQNVGIEQIYADGIPLLSHCAVLLLANMDGLDSIYNPTSCRMDPRTASPSPPALVPAPGGLTPSLPFEFLFSPSGDPTRMNFSARVGPSNIYDFKTVLMSVAVRKDIFTNFRSSRGLALKAFSANAIADPIADGRTSFIYLPPEQNDPFPQPWAEDWGELIGPNFTVRVTLTGQNRSRPRGRWPEFQLLGFASHPDVKSLDFSFANLEKDVSASIEGNIQVSRTDGVIWFPGQPQGSFPTTMHPFHQVGQNAGFSGGFEASVLDGAGFLSYGPYTTSTPQGFRTANFRIKTSSYFPYNGLIVAIEVYDAVSQQILARREVSRAEFTQGDQYQDFPLNFFAQPGQQLEYRTYTYGNYYVNQLGVFVQ